MKKYLILSNNSLQGQGLNLLILMLTNIPTVSGLVNISDLFPILIQI